MKHCTDVAERFNIPQCCETCAECHQTDGAGFTEELQQGRDTIPVCDAVFERVQDDGAYCSDHAEWYPAGLQCLSCSRE